LKEITNDPALNLTYTLLRRIRDKNGNYVKNENGEPVYAFTKREVELFKKGFVRFKEEEIKEVPVPTYIAKFSDEKAQRDLYGQNKTGKKVAKSGKEQREINFGPRETYIIIGRPVNVDGVLAKATEMEKELDEKEVKERLELFAKAIEQVTKSGNEEDKNKVKEAFEDFANWAIKEMKEKDNKKLIEDMKGTLEEFREKHPEIFGPKKNNKEQE